MRRRFEGWPLVGWTALGVSLLCAAIVLLAGTGPKAFGIAARVTACTSLFLFAAAFTASSLHVLQPRPFTRWLVSNRRHLGVSFAVSHGFHAAAIIGLAVTAPEHFRENLDPATLVFGGFGYVVLAAMTATSFDRTAAMIGTRWWKRLHGFGVWYLWFIFAATLLPETFDSSLHVLLSAVAVAMAGVRALAALSLRQRRLRTA